MSRFRLGHRPALDGLRGIFILLVLAVHGGIPFMQGAALGVDCFFVLSGFLITCLLLQEWQHRGSISLKRFYMRRALRLLPALYFMLVVISLLTIGVLKGEGAVATARGVLLSFLYTSNWFPVLFTDYRIGVGLMSHSWSLALEEQFYLVWPVLLTGLLSLRLSRKQLIICTMVLPLGPPLWRFWLLSNGYSDANYFLGFYTRADALLVGCALGALASGGLLLPSVHAARFTRWLTVAGVAILTYLVVDPSSLSTRPGYYGSFALIGLCAAMVILHILVSPHGNLARLLSWKPLVQLGVVSYGVYLWHNPVFFLLSPGSAGWLNLPVQFARLAITSLIVAISYRYLEKPMLRIKNRLSEEAPETVLTPATGYNA